MQTAGTGLPGLLSPIWRGWRPRADAAAVAWARAAGAVVIGKTVTTEFANRNPGPTANPHRFSHTPGGSSSGSAAGVADFFFPFAFGTQTAGSIIRPAAFCGGAYFLTGPFIGAVLVLGMFREPITSRFVAVAVLIGVGVWLRLAGHHEYEHTHDEMVHEHAHVHDGHHQHAHGPSDPPGEPHAHAHRHEPLVHTHPHYPDLHHRHTRTA